MIWIIIAAVVSYAMGWFLGYSHGRHNGIEIGIYRATRHRR